MWERGQSFCGFGMVKKTLVKSRHLTATNNPTMSTLLVADLTTRSFLMANAKSLRSGSCFVPTPKCPMGYVVWVSPPYSHSAVRDANLLLLDTASVQRGKNAARVLWTCFLLRRQNYKPLHAGSQIIRLRGGLHPDVVFTDSDWHGVYLVSLWGAGVDREYSVLAHRYTPIIQITFRHGRVSNQTNHLIWLRQKCRLLWKRHSLDERGVGSRGKCLLLLTALLHASKSARRRWRVDLGTAGVSRGFEPPATVQHSNL